MVERPGLEKAKDGLTRAADDIGKLARNASTQLIEQAMDLKDATVEKLGARHLLSYEEVTAEYNIAFTAMSDNGLSLLRQRERSTDLIGLVELLLNSIVNTPDVRGAGLEVEVRMVKHGGMPMKYTDDEDAAAIREVNLQKR